MRSQPVKRRRPQAVKRNDVSPTAPTFVILNDRLNQAHRRIRELEACAVITELTDDDHARSAADLSSRPLPTSAHGDGGDGRFGPGDQVGEHTSRRLGPAARPPAPADTPAPVSASGTGANRVKTRRFPYV